MTTHKPRAATLGPHGRALLGKMMSDFDLDTAQVEVLVAACRELDTAEALRDGADLTTKDGRQRISLARMAGLAFTSHMKALSAMLKPTTKPEPRRVTPQPTMPATDPRHALLEDD